MSNTRKDDNKTNSPKDDTKDANYKKQFNDISEALRGLEQASKDVAQKFQKFIDHELEGSYKMRHGKEAGKDATLDNKSTNRPKQP